VDYGLFSLPHSIVVLNNKDYKVDCGDELEDGFLG
jgi:hypothetical protein